MKKTTLLLLAIVILSFCTAAVFPAVAEEPAIPDPITMEESNDLIMEAIALRRTYQNAAYIVLASVASCYPPDAVADEQGVLYDPTEEKFRTEEARTATILAIYTGEAVSKVSIINPKLITNGKQNISYTLNGDLYIYSWRNEEKFEPESLFGSITNFAEYGRFFENKDLLITMPGEITQDENGVCTRTFTIVHNTQKLSKKSETYIKSDKVNVTAEFTKTEDGWRISGGTFIEALYPDGQEKPIPKTDDRTTLTVWTAAALLSLAALSLAASYKHTLSRKHR